jgi:hypothetical protein
MFGAVALLVVGIGAVGVAADRSRPREEATVEKRIAARGIDAVRANVFVGPVRVYADSPEAVQLKAVRIVEGGTAEERRRWIAESRLEIEQEGRTLVITDVVPKSERSGLRDRRREGFGARLEMDLHVPPGLALELTSLVGPTEVEGRVSDLKVQSTAGEVRLKKLECAGKRLEVNAAAGDITLDLRSLPSETLSVSVAAGTVRMGVPPSAKARVEMSTVTGSVASGARLASRKHSKGIVGQSLSGELNGGGVPVRIHVVAGEARLEAEGR